MDPAIGRYCFIKFFLLAKDHKQISNTYGNFEKLLKYKDAVEKYIPITDFIFFKIENKPITKSKILANAS